MRWPSLRRSCIRGGLLFLGLWQASGCGDGASTSATTPSTPPPAVANRAPLPSGAIPFQTLAAGGDEARVDVAPYFSDPDGDPLSYAVASGDAGVVRASMTGSIVLLNPVAAGTTIARVTATDSGGLSATQPMGVTVLPGEIPGGRPACRVGMSLRIGESCTVDIPGIDVADRWFEVTSDGAGCYGSICFPGSLTLGGFRASRQSDGRWRIDALPGGGETGPDLVVQPLAVNPVTVVPEGSFTLSATVRNQGAARSDSTALRYYRSSDAAISTGDTEEGTDFVSRLAAGASGPESIRLTAPSTAGTYYYGACVEPVSGESDTANNCSAGVPLTVQSAPAADLVVESAELSSSTVVPEARVTLSATVRNQGGGRSDSTTLRYYQSPDAVISTGDTEVGRDFVSRLSAGADGLESIRLTAPSTAGTYYYGACVEPVSKESDTANNCSAGVPLTVEAVPGPDLVVESPQVSSSAVAPEASFTLSATVRNQGGGRSDSTTLRYYRSSDATISTGDTEVGTDSVFRLAAGASGPESMRLTAPSTVGTYYYGACVEPVSQESDTANNCSAGASLVVEAVPGPDLVVESPEVSSTTVAPEASFTLSATVRNRGGGRSDSTTLRYYRSSDATISTGDTEVGTDFVSRLSAGADGLESMRLTAPNTVGTYYYGACVEPVSGESDTANNCSAGVSLTVEAVPGPDLVVESPEVSNSLVIPGAGFTLSVTVRNQGGTRSASTTLRYYRSVDAAISTGDTEEGTDSVFGLSAGRSGSESIRLTAPNSPGTYYYGACVEPVSGESDTANNCSAGVALTAESGGGDPDLVAESPEVSRNKVVPDGFFTLSATVRNRGTGASGSTTLRYYRSSDATISTSDTEVETTSLAALTAAGTVTASTLLRAPGSRGTYYYGACVDAVSGESDTGNNCTAGVRVEVGSTGPACTVGQLLGPGEFCTVAIPGFSLTDNRFRVTDEGEGCYEILCVRGSLSLNGFVATEQSDGRWRIDALPEGE